MFKKSIFSAAMLGLVAIAIASSGGGKKNTAKTTLGIVPLRANGTLVDKTKAGYAGSQLVSTVNLRNATVIRSVITYQKGNTTYIVPSKLRLNNTTATEICNIPKLNVRSNISSRSNLNLVDLKIRLSK